ncbi:hypothetical protein MO867_21975 [Microbulbifer sp. OS29]|uniref:Uncharacterized protein n=1 Tax=Microbulbifer okhotskensis TaxID=2926617 RepID=A0A9X2ET35_9GAMM|nr:hypothetical protein [Microbulbifer okhotskensis]MCO1336995.1 hypothetical protein [Microbulbifer okhotskensis]
MDEIASRLMSERKVRPLIVVAIDNVNTLRHGDYFPQKAQIFLSGERVFKTLCQLNGL